jgi:hypothetical protein
LRQLAESNCEALESVDEAATGNPKRKKPAISGGLSM